MKIEDLHPSPKQKDDHFKLFLSVPKRVGYTSMKQSVVSICVHRYQLDMWQQEDNKQVEMGLYLSKDNDTLFWLIGVGITKTRSAD